MLGCWLWNLPAQRFDPGFQMFVLLAIITERWQKIGVFFGGGLMDLNDIK